jgi:ATP-dependent Clp protease protease subunit
MKITIHCFIAFVGIAVLTSDLCAQSPSTTDTNSANTELKRKQDQLTLENSLAELQLKKELAKLTADKQRLELENSVALQKSQADLLTMQTELDKLTKQLDLIAKRGAVTEAERKRRLDAELAVDREKLERMRFTNDFAAVDLAAKSRDMSQREQELRVKAAELTTQRTELDLQSAKLNTDLDLREKRDQWKNRVNRDIQYTKEPFKDGVLHRRAH